MKKIYITLIILLFTVISISQPIVNRNKNTIDSISIEKTKYNSLDASVLIGMQNYYGDLANNNFFPGGTRNGIFNWNTGIKIKYNYSRYVGTQLNFSYGKMTSQLSSNNNYFNGTTVDFDLGIFINMTTLLNPKKYNKRWYWDVNFNYGGLKYDAESFDENDNSLGTSSELNAQMGFGSLIQYRISDKVDLGMDLRVNKVGHDLLDNVVKGKSNDSYGHVSLILGYTFGKNVESYKWNPMDDDLKKIWAAVEQNTNDIDSLDKRISKLEAYHGQGNETLPDDDNDGVPNILDKSPNTPDGIMVNFQGIPIPIQDTLNNNSDLILGSVFFDFNRATVSNEDYKTLASIAQYLNSHKNTRVEIVGNTDNIGSDEYNQKLSEKRSDAVIKILTEGFGIDSSRFDVIANGKKTELSNKYNDVNRRVDIIVK